MRLSLVVPVNFVFAIYTVYCVSYAHQALLSIKPLSSSRASYLLLSPGDALMVHDSMLSQSLM